MEGSHLKERGMWIDLDQNTATVVIYLQANTI